MYKSVIENKILFKEIIQFFKNDKVLELFLSQLQLPNFAESAESLKLIAIISRYLTGIIALNSAEEATKFVPILGSIVGFAVSSGTTYYSINYFLLLLIKIKLYST